MFPLEYFLPKPLWVIVLFLTGSLDASKVLLTNSSISFYNFLLHIPYPVPDHPTDSHEDALALQDHLKSLFCRMSHSTRIYRSIISYSSIFQFNHVCHIYTATRLFIFVTSQDQYVFIT